jgi:hypothetical protein
MPEINEKHRHELAGVLLLSAAVGREEASDLGGLEDADVGQSGG